ncbi:MAG: sodium:proton antiporter [Eubacteriaceae bacterium]|nr:sodium:proton antiporter [Eubacteriaceae bacterium]
MPFIINLPFFSVITCLIGAVLCSVFNDRNARRVCVVSIIIVIVFSASVFIQTASDGQYYHYVLGHFPAPWGNELRVGPLESLVCCGFGIILLLSLMGGDEYININVRREKRNRYFVLINLICVAMVAIVYTNDLFTAYVFLEILTLASCGILMIKEIGKTTIAATRYLILNLFGSGLFLFGIFLIYTMTGHLLMENIHEAIVLIVRNGNYDFPLTVACAVICTGLAIKSGLYPFHLWMPDTYAYSTPTSSAILSSFTSKVYIFLMIKIMFRVIGTDVEGMRNVMNIYLLFGLIAIIIGSVSAIKQHNINRMIAFSSTAQIGYIFTAISLSSVSGIAAGIYHIFAHSVTKSLLFISSARIIGVSGKSMAFHDLRGAAKRSPFASLMFTVGSLSMIGVPAFAGFSSKILISSAAAEKENTLSLVILVVLALSTILNTVYFLRTVINIYSTSKDSEKREKLYPEYVFASIMLAVLNIILGCYSVPVIKAITSGIELFI